MFMHGPIKSSHLTALTGFIRGRALCFSRRALPGFCQRTPTPIAGVLASLFGLGSGNPLDVLTLPLRLWSSLFYSLLADHPSAQTLGAFSPLAAQATLNSPAFYSGARS